MPFAIAHKVDAPSGAAEWNAYIAGNEGGSVYQTTYYAEYAQAIGFKPHYFEARDPKGELMGALLAFEKPVKASVAGRAVQLPLSSSGWVYGPVFESEEIARELLRAVAAWARLKKIPISEASAHPLADPVEAFASAGFSRKEWGTFLIDLAKSADELWRAVDHSARKLVNRTREDGVKVKAVETQAELRAYYRCVNESRKRARVPPYAYDDALFTNWKKYGVGEILIATKDEDVLAGLGTTFFNGYVNEWGAGQSDRAIAQKIYASDLLKWSVIETAKKRGDRYYDLTGANPEPLPGSKEAGIYKYKQKWGGEFKRYGVYSLAGGGFAHRAAQAVKKIRNKLTR